MDEACSDPELLARAGNEPDLFGLLFDLSYEEVAVALAIPVGAVRSRLNRPGEGSANCCADEWGRLRRDGLLERGAAARPQVEARRRLRDEAGECPLRGRAPGNDDRSDARVRLFRYSGSSDFVATWSQRGYGLQARRIAPDLRTFTKLVGTADPERLGDANDQVRFLDEHGIGRRASGSLLEESRPASGVPEDGRRNV